MINSSNTSRDTIKTLLRKMQKEMQDQMGDLKTNRAVFNQRGLDYCLPEEQSLYQEAVSDGLDGEWIKQKHKKSKAIILYLHGGGYSVGSAISHRPLSSLIAQYADCNIFSLNYRLAPENKFPCALEDSITALRWLQDQYAATHTIFIAGDSAGGGLGLATLLKLRDNNLPQPAGFIALSPWLDLECSSPSYELNKETDLMATAEGLRFVGRGYASQAIAKNPYISPFYAEDFSGLCPMLFQVGDAETLLDEVCSVAERSKQQGGNITLEISPNMTHVWHSLYGVIPEAEAAIQSIADWIVFQLDSKDQA